MRNKVSSTAQRTRCDGDVEENNATCAMLRVTPLAYRVSVTITNEITDMADYFVTLLMSAPLSSFDFSRWVAAHLSAKRI